MPKRGNIPCSVEKSKAKSNKSSGDPTEGQPLWNDMYNGMLALLVPEFVGFGDGLVVDFTAKSYESESGWIYGRFNAGYQKIECDDFCRTEFKGTPKECMHKVSSATTSGVASSRIGAIHSALRVACVGNF